MTARAAALILLSGRSTECCWEYSVIKLISRHFSTYDTAMVLKSLDLHLSSCDKDEAKKMEPISYSRITDLAAMYRIFVALCMHRPNFSWTYASAATIMHYKETWAWRYFTRTSEILAKMTDKSRAGIWRSFDDLNQFRMPTGKKDLEWLKRADGAVSESHYHRGPVSIHADDDS